MNQAHKENYYRTLMEADSQTLMEEDYRTLMAAADSQTL